MPTPKCANCGQYHAGYNLVCRKCWRAGLVRVRALPAYKRYVRDHKERVRVLERSALSYLYAPGAGRANH